MERAHNLIPFLWIKLAVLKETLLSINYLNLKDEEVRIMISYMRKNYQI
jgi:hypothetical protein